MTDAEALVLQQSMHRVAGSLTQQIQINGLLNQQFKEVCIRNGTLRTQRDILFWTIVGVAAVCVFEFALIIHFLLRSGS